MPQITSVNAAPFNMRAKPWIRHYDKGVPHTLHPYPEETLVNFLQKSAEEQPRHPAMYFKGTALSYRELEQQSNALAEALPFTMFLSMPK